LNCLKYKYLINPCSKGNKITTKKTSVVKNITPLSIPGIDGTIKVINKIIVKNGIINEIDLNEFFMCITPPE
jgi:hypothetical protein